MCLEYRNFTPLLLAIQFENVVGYREASMPPLYGKSHESAIRFLSKVDLSGFNNLFDIDEIMHYIDYV